MLTMAVGQSDDVDPGIAVAEAVDQCRTQLNGRTPTAGILFAAQDSFDMSLSVAVRNAFPDVGLIGSTSAAEMSSVVGYREDSVSLALFASDDIDLAVGFGDDVERDAAGAARAAVSQAMSATTQDPKVCVVLIDSVNGQNAIEAVRDALPPKVLIVGGAAGRNELGGTSPTYQFLNDHVSSNGVAILLLAGPVAYSTAVGTGWRVLGPRGVVTRSAYGTIHEIDGQPAAEWLSKYLDMTPGRTMGNPLAINDPGSEGWYLRVVLQTDQSGSVVILGSVPVGATVQLTTTSPEQMLEAAADAVQRARSAYPGQLEPSAALLFSCAVRKFLLGTRTDEEVEAARANLPPSLPIAGMYCIGEVGPTSQGDESHFMNESFVTLLLGS